MFRKDSQIPCSRTLTSERYRTSSYMFASFLMKNNHTNVSHQTKSGKTKKIKQCTCFALSCALCGAKWCNVCGKMRQNGIHEKFSEHFLLFWFGHDQINAYMTKG